MMQAPPPFQFQVSVETENSTGDVLAVYFYIRKGRYHHNKQFANGAVRADYDSNGFLLGVEILAPVRVKIVDELAREEPWQARSEIKRFMKKTGPRELVPA